jgi:hypothetical protein
VLVVREARRGLLVLILFSGLYLPRVVVLVALIHPLLEFQAALEEARTTAEVVFTAQLVKVFLDKATLVDCLGLAQTIRVAVVVVLEQLD